MTERLIEKLDRLGAEAGIQGMTPEIRRFALLVRADMVAQPEREPVTWAGVDFDINTAPPKRTWVGLTDEEIWGAVYRIGTSDSNVNPYQTIKDARAIEAKLKEKNSAML
jgi:hypothetical protein